MLYHKINKKTKENRKLKQKQKKKKNKKKEKKRVITYTLKTKALWLILTIPLNQIYSQPNKIN